MISKIVFTTLLTLNSLLYANENQEKNFESVIIGGGVGGGAAAIYLARAGFHPLVIEKSQPGSAIAQSDAVENWPGAIKIRGVELMERIQKQAEMNGAIFVDAEVVKVDFSHRPFTIIMHSLDQPDVYQTIYAQTCILATGSTANGLNILGEKKYWGRGVSCCAICDGSLYRNKHVGVVGGGDSAILEALYLSNIAQEVTLFVRNDHLKAIDATKKETLLNLPNVKVLYQTQLKEIKGNDENVTGVLFSQNEGSVQEKFLDALFLAIGSKPNTALFQKQIALDDHGYIVLKKGQQTSVEGVYAIGDVVDPVYKQAISAAGDGAKAALSVIQSDLSIKKTQVGSKKNELNQLGTQIVEITSAAQFEKEIKSSEMPLIIDFYATWCSPCKRIAPKIESMATSLAGKVKFLKVNVDEVGDLTQNYKIRSMPTVLYLNEKGVVIDRKVGEKEIGELLNQLNSRK